jgi:hypothetical protein
MRHRERSSPQVVAFCRFLALFGRAPFPISSSENKLWQFQNVVGPHSRLRHRERGRDRIFGAPDTIGSPLWRAAVRTAPHSPPGDGEAPIRLRRASSGNRASDLPSIWLFWDTERMKVVSCLANVGIDLGPSRTASTQLPYTVYITIYGVLLFSLTHCAIFREKYKRRLRFGKYLKNFPKSFLGIIARGNRPLLIPGFEPSSRLCVRGTVNRWDRSAKWSQFRSDSLPPWLAVFL